MRLDSMVFGGLLLLMTATAAPAQDCNARCCKKIFNSRVCEPVCKSSCEAEKAARGAGVPVPDIGPSKGWELGQKLLTISCAAGFETIMKPAILNTGFPCGRRGFHKRLCANARECRHNCSPRV